MLKPMLIVLAIIIAFSFMGADTTTGSENNSQTKALLFFGIAGALIYLNKRTSYIPKLTAKKFRSITLKCAIWMLLLAFSMGLIIESGLSENLVGLLLLSTLVTITYLVFFYNFKRPFNIGSNKIKLSPKNIPLDHLSNEFVVIDFETTGLNPERNKILEIGAIKVNKATETLTEYQTLVIPKGKVPETITDITGITTQMAKQQGKPIEVAIKELLAFIDNKPIVAFNAQFDLGFLRKALHDTNTPFLPFKQSCALQMARQAWPDLPNHKLTTLAKAFKLDTKGNHRALKDAELALKIYLLASEKLGYS